VADDNEKLMETTIIPGRGAIYGKGSSGEGARDYLFGDNKDSEGGSTGPGDAPFTRKRGPQSSTGPGAAPFTAVQAPNRPK